MSEKNDGGPAFPMRSEPHYTPDSKWEIEQKGMSLRDYLAAHAPDIFGHLTMGWGELSLDEWAKRNAEWKYLHADAMLAARDK